MFLYDDKEREIPGPGLLYLYGFSGARFKCFYTAGGGLERINNLVLITNYMKYNICRFRLLVKL
jgi:hypothetical protein